ncbi:MAG: S24/S26 family peptidase [Clostridia bacterium]|nr:S24/S26 family peptidase [Clostridia bacterium]
MMNTDIKSILEEKGVFVSTTSGVSMMPMLRDRRDTIVIKPCTERPRKRDVVLYLRDDGYVLHRIIGERADGFVIRGDNCVAKEFGITEDMIIGRLCEFYRDEERVDMSRLSYRAYSAAICWLNPILTLLHRIKCKLCASRKRKN